MKPLDQPSSRTQRIACDRHLRAADDIYGDIASTFTSTTNDEYGDLLSDEDGGGERYPMYDAQLCTNVMLDGAGNVQGQYKYLAFGQAHSAEASPGEGWASLTVDQWSSMSIDDWTNLPIIAGGGLPGMGGGFAQKQYYLDPETELYMLGMGGGTGRHYDPAAGRFISEDKIRQAGGDNVYNYVADDPINKADPSGMQVASNAPEALSKDEAFIQSVKKELQTQGVLGDANAREILRRFRDRMPADGIRTGDILKDPYVTAAMDTVSAAETPEELMVYVAGYLAGRWGGRDGADMTHFLPRDITNIISENESDYPRPRTALEVRRTKGWAMILGGAAMIGGAAATDGFLGKFGKSEPALPAREPPVDTAERILGASGEEQDIDQALRSEGREVKPNLEEGAQGAGRQGDRFIDGVKTEYKTVSGVRQTDADSLSGKIASRIMDARGQAGNVIVDVRKQPGMTKEIAERGIRRAYGADNKVGGKIQSIRVIGSDFDITVPRE